MPRNSSPSSSDCGAGPSNIIAMNDYDQIDEPSPLDRILAEGRSYNGGNWGSEELKTLFDGVHKYGASKGAIAYIVRSMSKKRTEEEIQAKLDEIREIIKENKEIILPEFYRKRWIGAGHRNIDRPEDCEVNPNENWCSITNKIVHHHHPSINKTINPMRESLDKLLNEFSQKSKQVDDALVTSMQTARATTTDTQTVRWPVIYQFMRSCATIEDEMPPINELEAAIISKVIDTIEDEASTISNNEKAVLSGIFTECQLNDFRFCEQDYPPNAQSGLQLFIDPLKTRSLGIPEVAAEVEMIGHNQGPSTSSS